MVNGIKRQIRWYAPQQEDPITRKELESLHPQGRATLLAAINRFKNGCPGVTPRQIDKDIYEIRVAVSNNHYRAFIFQDSPVHYIIVRVFFKNTQRTPRQDLEVARKRMKRWKDRNHRNA